MRSQADLEHKLTERTAQLENGKLTFQQAFGNLDDWMLELGVRKAFLHPNRQEWLFYDRLHHQWVTAGCGVNEAVLLAVGRTIGIKKLSEPGPVNEWCVFRQVNALSGPLRISELHAKLKIGQVNPNVAVWSTYATGWLKIAFYDEHTLALASSEGKIVLRLSEGSLLPRE